MEHFSVYTHMILEYYIDLDTQTVPQKHMFTMIMLISIEIRSSLLVDVLHYKILYENVWTTGCFLYFQ